MNIKIHKDNKLHFSVNIYIYNVSKEEVMEKIALVKQNF